MKHLSLFIAFLFVIALGAAGARSKRGRAKTRACKKTGAGAETIEVSPQERVPRD
jgi:hypothetical protein